MWTNCVNDFAMEPWTWINEIVGWVHHRIISKSYSRNPAQVINWRDHTLFVAQLDILNYVLSNRQRNRKRRRKKMRIRRKRIQVALNWVANGDVTCILILNEAKKKHGEVSWVRIVIIANQLVLDTAFFWRIWLAWNDGQGLCSVYRLYFILCISSRIRICFMFQLGERSPIQFCDHC